MIDVEYLWAQRRLEQTRRNNEALQAWARKYYADHVPRHRDYADIVNTLREIRRVDRRDSIIAAVLFGATVAYMGWQIWRAL